MKTSRNINPKVWLVPGPHPMSMSEGRPRSRHSLALRVTHLHNQLINQRQTVMAPLAAFTMAWVLFAYTKHSIQAAKLNAVCPHFTFVIYLSRVYHFIWDVWLSTPYQTDVIMCLYSIVLSSDSGLETRSCLEEYNQNIDCHLIENHTRTKSTTAISPARARISEREAFGQVTTIRIM